MADATIDPLVTIKAQKDKFVHDLQQCMGGTIVQWTSGSQTNEGKLITGLPPKKVINFVICLSDEEHDLLTNELHMVGEET